MQQADNNCTVISTEFTAILVKVVLRATSCFSAARAVDCDMSSLEVIV